MIFFVKSNIMRILKEQYDENITSGKVIDIVIKNKPEKSDIINILRNNFEIEITDDRITDALSGYINGERMVSLVAKNCTLNIDQVKEVFKTYREIVDTIANSNNMIDMGFSIPYFGKVEVKHKKGRKAGTHISKASQIGGKHTLLTLEEDMPDYNRYFVNVSPILQNQLKENSIKRNNNR